MSVSDHRRVRKLRLRSSDRQLIRRAAILVEDALHTASLPNSGSGLLCIRRISLGQFTCDQNSMSLTKVIEEQLKSCQMVAADPMDPNAVEATAVRFRNDTEPYLMLLERLAAGESVDAWYWSSAVREWDPTDSPPTAIRKIIHGVQKVEQGTIELAKWLRAANSSRFERIVEAIRPEDAVRLLANIGLTDAQYLRTTVPMNELAERAYPSFQRRVPAWAQPCRVWIEHWGTDDLRSHWLVAIMLVAENPTRLCSTAWPESVVLTVRAIQDYASHRKRPMSQSKAGIYDTDTLGIQNDRLDAKEINRANRPSRDQPSAIERVESQSEFSSSDSNLSPDCSEEKKLRSIDGKHDPLNSHESNAPRLGFLETNPVPTPLHYDSNPEDTKPVDLVPFDNRSSVSQIATHRAGLFLLIRVLEFLGIEEWLQRHDEWIELRLPIWILHDIAQRMGTEPMDPVMRAIDVDDLIPESERAGDFVIPQRWHDGITTPGQCIIQECETGFVLLDSSEQLPMAFWQEPAAMGLIPERILSELGEGEWQFTSGVNTPLSHLSPWDLLLRSWRYALRRWCRQFVGAGLHDVVSRFGHLGATSTHIDVSFSIQESDARIRKAGLDIDPGWMSWLGKILYFHYTDHQDEPSKSH